MTVRKKVPKPGGPRIVETVKSWPEATARLRQVRAAGYKATATDLGEHIAIHISPGKHADLSRLPARKVVDLVPRQKEAKDICDFIDSFGGRLGAFRGYGASRPAEISPEDQPREREDRRES